MRLKHNRIQKIKLFPRSVLKDKEGCTVEQFGKPKVINGIAWPTSSSTQKELYGSVCLDAHSIKVDGPYSRVLEQNHISYVLQDLTVISALDGISLDLISEKPEYQIKAVQPYRNLQLEVVRID